MANRTPLFAAHQALGAKMMQFRGWDMPLHYGSQIEEHFQVRGDVGLFDVSHLNRVDVEGEEAEAFLRYLLTNDVARLDPGEGFYSCMLMETGGILDDLIVFKYDAAHYRLVMNPGAFFRDRNLAWIQDHARAFDVAIKERNDLAMLSVQGPHALTCLEHVLGSELPLKDLSSFHGVVTDQGFISRTGYTGEDGFEIMLASELALGFWQALIEADAQPCGLGARDTLRMEAGLLLYGSDIDETTSPLVSGLEKTVAWEPAAREFIGRSALGQQCDAGTNLTLAGLILEEQGGVLRAQQRIVTPSGATGLITSGTFSPTLNRAIALARVPSDIGDHCQVHIRYKYCPALVVKPPFVRHGQCLYKLPLY